MLLCGGARGCYPKGVPSYIFVLPAREGVFIKTFAVAILGEAVINLFAYFQISL